jgi:methylmalonyl-CoA mutase C-terminal domain/subunit
MAKTIKVLVAKPGLDGHDRGAKFVVRVLRDAGMEVIYSGLRQTPDMIAESAMQEDVDVVGLSILSGAHLDIFPTVMDKLKKKGLKVVVVAGGIIPEEDVPALKKIGVNAVFGPGTPSGEIVKFLNGAVN